MIAPFMTDEMTPSDWAATCFITDLSSVGDFLRSDEEATEADIRTLSQKVGFPVERDTLLCDIAATMRGI